MGGPTLIPERLREKKGGGGRGEEFRDLYIPDNEGRISLLRQDREIYYDLVPKLYPGGKDVVDRYIGVEVSFPRALDEYFQVRHVKRGAEPVAKLREELRKALKRPIEHSRKRIRAYWGEVEAATRAKGGLGHETAVDAATAADTTSPQGKAGMHLDDVKIQETFEELYSQLGLDLTTEEGRQRAEGIRKAHEEHPITVIDMSWPGKEVFEIVHLSGKSMMKLNHGRPFVAEIYDQVKGAADRLKADPTSLQGEEMLELLRKVEVGIDMLLMAYAKAESLHREPEEAYGELRSLWGVFTTAYVKNALARLA